MLLLLLGPSYVILKCLGRFGRKVGVLLLFITPSYGFSKYLGERKQGWRDVIVIVSLELRLRYMFGRGVVTG